MKRTKHALFALMVVLATLGMIPAQAQFYDPGSRYRRPSGGQSQTGDTSRYRRPSGGRSTDYGRLPTPEPTTTAQNGPTGDSSDSGDKDTSKGPNVATRRR